MVSKRIMLFRGESFNPEKDKIISFPFLETMNYKFVLQIINVSFQEEDYNLVVISSLPLTKY